MKDKMLLMASEMKEKEITAQLLAQEAEGLSDNFTRLDIMIISFPLQFVQFIIIYFLTVSFTD